MWEEGYGLGEEGERGGVRECEVAEEEGEGEASWEGGMGGEWEEGAEWWEGGGAGGGVGGEVGGEGGDLVVVLACETWLREGGERGKGRGGKYFDHVGEDVA